MIELWDIVDEHGNRTGKTMVKGTPMKKGEYHLSVSVWIQNDAGDYLVSQRVPTKIAPNICGKLQEALQSAVKTVYLRPCAKLRKNWGSHFTLKMAEY